MSDGGRGHEEAAGRGVGSNFINTLLAPPCLSYPFQECTQWLKLWKYSQQSKCFWMRYNTAWSFEASPAVTTLRWLQLCTMLGGSSSKLSGHYQSQLPMSQMNQLPLSSEHKLEATGSSERWLNGCHITDDRVPCENKTLDAACSLRSK
jgi:hypothetical protein